MTLQASRAIFRSVHTEVVVDAAHHDFFVSGTGLRSFRLAASRRGLAEVLQIVDLGNGGLSFDANEGYVVDALVVAARARNPRAEHRWCVVAASSPTATCSTTSCVLRQRRLPSADSKTTSPTPPPRSARRSGRTNSRGGANCIAGAAAFSGRSTGSSFLFHIEYGGAAATVEVGSDGVVLEARGPLNSANSAVHYGRAVLTTWGMPLCFPIMGEATRMPWMPGVPSLPQGERITTVADLRAATAGLLTPSQLNDGAVLQWCWMAASRAAQGRCWLALSRVTGQPLEIVSLDATGDVEGSTSLRSR